MKTKTRNAVVKEKAGVPPSVTIKPAKAPREVDYSRAKITRDMTVYPTARYQELVLPGDPRYPSFASRPIGTYDEVPA